MLVELGLVEQRYKAVSEVLVDGATVTDVARRLGVSRQTVHTWLRRYGNGGMADLVDRSSRPDRCPHQTPAELEAAIVTMRRAHPAWVPGGCASSSTGPAWTPCPPAPRCIGSWSATASSTPNDDDVGERTTGAGSAPAPWSCGRWT